MSPVSCLWGKDFQPLSPFLSSKEQVQNCWFKEWGNSETKERQSGVQCRLGAGFWFLLRGCRAICSEFFHRTWSLHYVEEGKPLHEVTTKKRGLSVMGWEELSRAHLFNCMARQTFVYLTFALAIFWWIVFLPLEVPGPYLHLPSSERHQNLNCLTVRNCLTVFVGLP